MLKEADLQRIEKLSQEALVAAAEMESAAKQLRETAGLVGQPVLPKVAGEWRAPPAAHREHVDAHRDSGLHSHLPPPAVKATEHMAPSDGLGGGERKLLTAAAQHGGEGVTREHLSILTGFKKSYRDKVIQLLKR